MERMGWNSFRYRTSLLVVLCSMFLLLCGVSFKYSIFDHFESFSKERAFVGSGQNLTHKNLGSIVQANISSEAGNLT